MNSKVKLSPVAIAISLAFFNIALYLLFPMPGFRRWDGLMTATATAHFDTTPWEVLLYFAHTLVIPLTKLFHIIVPELNSMIIPALREVSFSAVNVVIIYYFFRTYLKKDLPAVLLALTYIFCNAHWQFTTGGEEKDTMLVLNMVYLIAFFQYRGWINLGWTFFNPTDNRDAGQVNRWSWLRPEYLLGIILALSIMIHLENTLLILTTIVIYLAHKEFYSNTRLEITALLRILLSAGIILLLWFGFVIFGINRISNFSDAVYWLTEYHSSGEFFDANINFYKQYIGAYQGFRRFLVGNHFEHGLLSLEAIVITCIVTVLGIKSYRHAPQLIKPALIYIGILTAHFFFWLPWDPEQWNPVVFAGFILLSPAVFVTKKKIGLYSGLALVLILIAVNIYSYNIDATKYRAIYLENRENNPDRLDGFNGFFLRNIPYANLAQLIDHHTEPGAIIFLDHRHIANHLLIFSDCQPIVSKYINVDSTELRRDYYLSQLSLHFYKPAYLIEELDDAIHSGKNAYYLSNSRRSYRFLSDTFGVKLAVKKQFDLNGFQLMRLEID